MSENRMAASSSKRDSGCSVTSQASLRVLAQLQEAAGAAPRLVVLGQVAAGLAHQPDRGVIHGLAQQCAQEGVVLGAGRG
jgi:C4-dicarboxylate-specific signal transduction histidine kinase